MEQLRGGGCEHPNVEVAVDHHDGDARAAKQVGQIVLRLRESEIETLELLIAGLELLLGGLQLFIHALKLFVAR